MHVWACGKLEVVFRFKFGLCNVIVSKEKKKTSSETGSTNETLRNGRYDVMTHVNS